MFPVLLHWGKIVHCGFCEMLVLRVGGVRQNHYVVSLYRKPEQDDQSFDYLLASMAAL